MHEAKALIRPDRGEPAVAIHLVNKDGFEAFAKALSPVQRAALAAQKFEGGGYQTAILPDGDGWLAVGGVANPESLSAWCLAKLAEELPEGVYRVANAEPGPAMFGWITGQYRFTRYKSEDNAGGRGAQGPRVLLTGQVGQVGQIEGYASEAEAECLLRDLVNAPPEDMGPAALEAECSALAKAHKAELTVVRGDALEQDYPMVHAVGRAAARHHAPRLMHLTWGDPAHPVLAVVGKGVCFDSGGLDIKPGSGMRLMKKDMGGAAHAIALAGLIMGARLKVRLHLLIPAVENAISGNAFRPGDILRTRKGLTVEIDNTDAEGRLILGDALTRASEEEPDLIVDFATLTGAARVALGPDLPALFARRDETAEAFLAAGRANDDAAWRLPLHEAYREYLASDVADMANSAPNPFAGASVAGLFLDRFVGAKEDGTPIDWVHFDTFAWTPAPKPGRARGGRGLGLRASWHAIRARYAA